MRVLFVARYKAGQRGANMIELGDLLLGLILEDTGGIEKLLSDMHGENEPTSVLPPPSHSPFFPGESAGELLTVIESLLTHSEPIVDTIEVPLSPEIERAFDGARDVQNEFHHKQIEPLHLLAAVLTQESSQHVKVLVQAGITKELVLQRLRATES
jgi:hypothetical protein